MSCHFWIMLCKRLMGCFGVKLDPAKLLQHHESRAAPCVLPEIFEAEIFEKCEPMLPVARQDYFTAFFQQPRIGLPEQNRHHIRNTQRNLYFALPWLAVTHVGIAGGVLYLIVNGQRG